ncbi:MAG TPA: PQQ-binding-like beta-propeller repeat protein, partial [Gemmatimonadales bacterium]|nr:PQQ-binding-like beta-propeller repeat protein [Gemmatimonadales bacterium]
SSWVRVEGKISPDAVQQPGFELLWTIRVEAEATRAPAVTPPVLLDLVIGYRWFRALEFVAGRLDHVLAIDSDLGGIEWERRLTAPATSSRAPACAASVPLNLARPTSAALPPVVVGYGGGRMGVPARGAVGTAGEGAVTLTPAAAHGGNAAPAPPGPPAPPAVLKPAAQRSSLRPFPIVYALSSTGMLHTLNVVNGADAEPPLAFLPPHAIARGLIVVDDIAYVATGRGCGAAPDGVWALDLDSRQVATWHSAGAIAGSVGPAIGPDGTLYVATTHGELVTLAPRTLKAKNVSRSGGVPFASSPVLFEHRGRMLVAASTRDGRIHVLDSRDLADVTGAVISASGLAGGTLASWVAPDGTRWLLAAAAGPVLTDAGFALRGGAVTHGAIVAWRVVEQNGAPALEPGWVSRDMIAPLGPVVIRGVVFAVASGAARPTERQRPNTAPAERSSPAILYALDGATGRELWSSGITLTAGVRGGLSGGGSEVYVGADDGTLYAFGFPMEH